MDESYDWLIKVQLTFLKYKFLLTIVLISGVTYLYQSIILDDAYCVSYPKYLNGKT